MIHVPMPKIDELQAASGTSPQKKTGSGRRRVLRRLSSSRDVDAAKRKRVLRSPGGPLTPNTARGVGPLNLKHARGHRDEHVHVTPPAASADASMQAQHAAGSDMSLETDVGGGSPTVADDGVAEGDSESSGSDDDMADDDGASGGHPDHHHPHALRMRLQAAVMAAQQDLTGRPTSAATPAHTAVVPPQPPGEKHTQERSCVVS